MVLGKIGSSYHLDMVRTEIEDIVGRDSVLDSEVDRLAYSSDIFWVPVMWTDRGKLPSLADLIVFPETVEQVSRLVRLANVYRIPIVPWGGGSGSQGGILPIYGGLILDIKKLNRIIDIDETSLCVTAEAGINGQHLEWALQDKGLTLAHYPASIYTATLGGYLAARGSGQLSTKYGKAEDMVLSIEVVTPTGEVIQTLPTPNHATGPGMLQLFVGSEGTFGIITKATMRVDPMPTERRFRAVLFPSLKQGLEAGRLIMTRRLRPSVIRLYDEDATVKVVKRVLGIEVKGAYMVLCFDGVYPDMVELEESKALEICCENGGKDLGSEGGKHWWEHKYDFYYPPFAPALPQLFGTIESVCRYQDIWRLYQAKRRVVLEEFAEWKPSYTAHFSHWYPWGVMIYDRFYVDAPPDDPHEAVRLHNRIWAAAARASMANGGVLNEHHGIGLKLGWLMREQRGAAFDVLQRIKDGLDPRGIMNPGKLGFRVP